MKKRALLVGINYVGSSRPLRGCINDSNNMKEYLQTQGFTEIKQIHEQAATTDGIKTGLAWLTDGAIPGDVILFHYSGHGSQLPSRTEQDGLEEIICPIDLDWSRKLISDADLKKIFNKVPNGVNTTLILDCCHSGTMLNQTESLEVKKDIKKSQKYSKNSRYLKPPASVLKELKNRTRVEWNTSRDVNQSALLIAGCQDDQTSADATINGVPRGAATAALLRAVSVNPGISYRALVENMREFMKTYKFEQIPMLDGSPALYDRPFLQPFSTINDTVTEPTPDYPTPVQPETPPSSESGEKPVSGIAKFINMIVKLFKSIFSK